MKIINLITGLILVVILLEIVKHFFFKKTYKIIMIFFVILVLFLIFSYSFKNVETFQDNAFIQTGAVIAGEINGFLKERGDFQSFFNSTVKSNKLFKS